ncbi:MAG: hypothetical protein ACJAXH_002377, partial [Colwellia sp.]
SIVHHLHFQLDFLVKNFQLIKTHLKAKLKAPLPLYYSRRITGSSPVSSTIFIAYLISLSLILKSYLVF